MGTSAEMGDTCTGCNGKIDRGFDATAEPKCKCELGRRISVKWRGPVLSLIWGLTTNLKPPSN